MNTILTTIDGALLFFVYVAAINVKNEEHIEVEEDPSFYLSITLLVICGAKMLIVPVYTIYSFKKQELDSEERQKRCGVAFEHLNYKNRSYWALLYPVF